MQPTANIRSSYALHNIFSFLTLIYGLPWWLSREQSACQCRRCGFKPWVGKISWRRKWQPTPIFLPGKYHKQRRLAGYSLWGCKQSEMTEHASKHIYTHTHTHTHTYIYVAHTCASIYEPDDWQLTAPAHLAFHLQQRQCQAQCLAHFFLDRLHYPLIYFTDSKRTKQMIWWFW